MAVVSPLWIQLVLALGDMARQKILINLNFLNNFFLFFNIKPHEVTFTIVIRDNRLYSVNKPQLNKNMNVFHCRTISFTQICHCPPPDSKTYAVSDSKLCV